MAPHPNQKVKLGTPSVASLLPEGHYSYTEAKRVMLPAKKKGFIRFPVSIARLFRGLGVGMKVAFGTLFFLICLAIPTVSAATVINLASSSTPVEAIRNQDVPSTGDVYQKKRGIQIDISWIED